MTYYTDAVVAATARNKELFASYNDNMSVVEKFEASLCWAVSAQTETLAKWAEKFAADPLYAFEWAQGTVVAAAKQKAALEFLATLYKVRDTYKEKTAEEVVKFAFDAFSREAVRAARYTENSTSQVSNVAKTEYKAECLRLVEDMERFYQ